MSELRGITWDHPRGFNPLVAASEVYAQSHRVRVVWEARSLKDFGDASLGELARDYDLMVVDHPHVGEAASANCLVPFNEVCPAQDLQLLGLASAGPSFASYHYAGNQWALPVDAACHVSARRPDLLEIMEPLPTWENVLVLAKQLRTRNLWMAMALCPTDCLCSFLTLCAQHGDAPVEGKKWIQRETTIAVLELLRSLRDACHPKSLDWNPIALYDAMCSEDLIAYCPLAFGYINYTSAEFRGRALAFGGIPGSIGALLGGAGIAISARVADPVVAARYCLWVCGPDCQANTYLASGGQPGHVAAWKRDSVDAATRLFLQPTRTTIEQAYVRPRCAGWPCFQEELGNRVHAFLMKDGDAADLHAELESRFMERISNHETI